MAPDTEGTEPDARFTMANERTFLAWNRTALALIGGGLAAGQLLDFRSDALRLLAALPPILLGIALALVSFRRWARTQHALRTGAPLPEGPLRPLAFGVAAAGVVVAAVVVIDALAA